MLYILVSIYFPQRLRVVLRIHAQQKRWRFNGTTNGKQKKNLWNTREIMMEKYFHTQQFPLQIQSNEPKVCWPKFRDNWNQQFSQSHYEVTGEIFSHLYGLLLLLWMFCVGLRSDVARIQSCSYWNFYMLLSCCSQHSPFNFNFYSIYGFFSSFFILYSKHKSSVL